MECAYPDGSVVTARKGVGMYHLRVKGVAAHAGADPDKGVSAIEEMARKITAICALTDFEAGTTLNVGIVTGGTRRNVIAASAEAEIDLRAATGAEAVRADEALRQIAAAAYVKGTSATIAGGLNRPPMEHTLEVGSLFRLVGSEGAKLGMRITERSTGGGSDGNFIGALGTPVIDGMGPQGGFAHSLNEFMKVSTFPLWVTLLAWSMLAVCCR
jgi:glutamate carboxypeptidase